MTIQRPRSISLMVFRWFSTNTFANPGQRSANVIANAFRRFDQTGVCNSCIRGDSGTRKDDDCGIGCLVESVCGRQEELRTVVGDWPCLVGDERNLYIRYRPQHGVRADRIERISPERILRQPVLRFAFARCARSDSRALVAPTVTAVGALPAGLTLTEVGVLSGTHTEAGVFAVVFTAYNSMGTPATLGATLTIAAVPEPPATGSLGTFRILTR